MMVSLTTVIPLSDLIKNYSLVNPVFWNCQSISDSMCWSNRENYYIHYYPLDPGGIRYSKVGMTATTHKGHRQSGE